ncbi:hypothetical protein D5S18_30920 [Nocardia panacis]|uniref:Uncharacterized protein n=1 Tax=Nocardia panacis TaxID=2340916 RepID=A0A3A4K819_9NOCA|nr:hypothetical protein [Nocardia panacis]RJO69087.1 hypothetical protein D5S18_30920 [Nocardia panacis]
MPVLLVLNELSCAHQMPQESVGRAMEAFVATLRAVESAAVLVTSEKLPNIELAQGYPMSRWAADGRNRDLWRAIRLKQSRAPFTFAELEPVGPEDGEYRHEGVLAKGLGVAHGHEGLAVSLATHGNWSKTSVGLTRLWIEADQVNDAEVVVRHASCADHVDSHTDWLKTCELDATVESGLQIWTRRADYFPSLTFLARVQNDLGTLTPQWVRPVLIRLRELDMAIGGWRRTGAALPVWGSHTTGEYEGRRRICEFEDMDGVTQVFDWHSRFTPGHGRIHFRLVSADRSARVAYIGRKLGV